MPGKRAPLAERLWRRTDKSGDCWVWTGSIRDDGYGQIGRGGGAGGVVLTHRAAWEVTNGPIPAGLYVCHSCDNRSCIHPEHLFLGTHKDNMRDMFDKGRNRSGVHPGVILTEEDVLLIRHLEARGVSRPALAVAFGVTVWGIHSAVQGRSWKHVPFPNRAA